MRWEGLLQHGTSPGSEAGRQHGAQILQARPSSDRGQCRRREPQRSRIQALPNLSSGGMEGLAAKPLFSGWRYEERIEVRTEVAMRSGHSKARYRTGKSVPRNRFAESSDCLRKSSMSGLAIPADRRPQIVARAIQTSGQSILESERLSLAHHGTPS
jgi:hypothetical protein